MSKKISLIVREKRITKSHWAYQVALDFINSLGSEWHITRHSDRYAKTITATLDPLYEEQPSLFVDHS